MTGRMMKFILQHVKNGCRVGQLVELPDSVTKKCVDTPMCMLYTRAGSIPYLGRDVLDRIDGHPVMVNMPLSLLAESHDVIGEFGGGVKKFSGLQEFMSYVSLQDPAVLTPSGFNQKNLVAVWGRGGKYQLESSEYSELVRTLQADWIQSLSDSDTSENSTQKRVRKSVDNTLYYLDKLLEDCLEHQELQKCGIIGTIEGGYRLEERLRSARETASRAVAGFAVEGFHNFGPESEKFDLSTVKDLLEKTLELLPKEKPRIFPGVMNPANILVAVELGFDIFDSSYPYLASERGSGLCYSYQLPADPDPESSISESWEISLKDDIYRDDLTKLLPTCTCYTCTHHTKAYINHLLNVQEILAGVLLNIHNLHHYLRTFDAIRRAVKDDTFTLLKQHIMAQHPS